MNLGAESELDNELKARQATCKPNQVCNLVYTSGTTGMPKGVMLTHDNLTYFNQSALNDALDDYREPGQEVPLERLITYLPLSHIAG